MSQTQIRMQPDLVATLPDCFTVYLARHATPDRSRYDIPYNTPPGPHLTERGLQEAEQLGVFLSGMGVRKVLASPFERAARTATIAAEQASLPVEINPDLAEWRPDEVEAGVMERMQRVFEQAANLSANLLDQPCVPVALVSHGSPVLTLLKALGLPHEQIERHRLYDSRNLIPMGGAWRVERTDGELRMQLVHAPQGVRLPAYA